MIEGIATFLERVKAVLDNARSESMPATATDTLLEWHHALGIKYDPTLPLEKQRAMLDAIITAGGSATKDGLALQISKEYSGLAVAETDGTNYAITGQVQTSQDARRVGAICAHFAPLHLVPTVFGYTAPTSGNGNAVPVVPNTDDGSIISTNRLARCGVVTTGLARVGKES